MLASSYVYADYIKFGNYIILTHNYIFIGWLSCHPLGKSCSISVLASSYVHANYIKFGLVG